MLADGTQVGTMSAVVYSHRLGRTIGLAQTATAVVESAIPVTVETPTGPQGATMHPLPFI